MNNPLLAKVIAEALADYYHAYGEDNTALDVSQALKKSGIPLETIVSRSLSHPSPPYAAPPVASSTETITEVPEKVSLENAPIALAEEKPSTIEWTPSQKAALSKANKWLHSLSEWRNQPPSSRYFLLKGYAGTGKSFLLKQLAEAHPNLNFLFSAPTHQAVRVMSSYLGQPASTLASRLGVRAVYNEDSLEFQMPDRMPLILPGSVLVVDEAFMLNSDYVRFLQNVAESLNLFVMGVGDPLQIPPIGEKKSLIGSLVTSPEFRHTLTDVKRTDHPALLDFLTDVRSQILSRSYQNNLLDYLSSGQLENASTEKAFLRQIRNHLDQIDSGEAKVVAWRNKTVDYYSECVRGLLGRSGSIDVGDRLRLSGSFIPFESMTVGEVGLTTEEVKVCNVETSVLRPWFLNQTWNTTEIPVIVAEIDGQTFDRHSVAIPDPSREGPAMLSSLLSHIAKTARSETGKTSKDTWSQFWETKARFVQPRFAYSNTAHTFQGGQAKTVFVSTEDILSNPLKREAFRCWYVGASRATEKVVSH